MYKLTKQMQLTVSEYFKLYLIVPSSIRASLHNTEAFLYQIYSQARSERHHTNSTVYNPEAVVGRAFRALSWVTKPTKLLVFERARKDFGTQNRLLYQKLPNFCITNSIQFNSIQFHLNTVKFNRNTLINNNET